MLSFKQHLFEKFCPKDDNIVTKKDLNQLEKSLDAIFNKLGVDIEFTRHFLDRVNDKRNKQQISYCELEQIFKAVYATHAKNVADSVDDIEAVIKDNATMIHMPVAIQWNHKTKMMELVTKTVMRKKDFKFGDKKLPVNSVVGR